MYGLIVFLPLLGFLVAGLFGDRIGARASELVTTTLLFASALLSWVAFTQVGLSGEVFRVAPIGTWMQSGGLDIQWSLRIDTLTVVMLVVVTTVSALVHLYSIGYMHEDPARPRFFAYLSLFTFAMLMLVTADNLVQMFFGWEGVGLASYLLIGFWYQKPSANAAAIKAFVVNRVGDFGFSLGIFLTFVLTQSVTFDAVFAAAPSWAGKGVHVFGMNVDAWTIACLLLFMGAMGKSAQFLLHTWLPDAMEGPTPVSALIHAATMVTAGVFMVARLSPLFELSPNALAFVTVVGATTAFFAATVGLVQNDIKRVIAYSTCSQLGYMFVGLGVGGYALGVFHLFTHAFFKALLFLGAGSVIHAMHHEQDMRNMGGLKDKIPKTYLMMVIGTLALTGFPMTAGYFSKDAIIEAAYAAGTIKASAIYAFGLTVVAALFTAFYSWRLIFMTFHGEPRWASAHGHGDAHAQAVAHDDHGHGAHAAHGHDAQADHARSADAHADDAHDDHAHHGPLDPHESPSVMLWPLAILTGGALFAGVAFRHLFIGTSMDEFWRGALAHGPGNTVMHDMHNIPSWVAWVPFIMMSVGTLGAIYAYLVRTDLPSRVVAANPWLYKFLLNKWYFDELYDLIFVRPAFWLGRLFWGVDRNVIDRFGPDGLSSGVVALTARVVRLQTGYVYHYAFAMLLGVAGFLTWYLLGGRALMFGFGILTGLIVLPLVGAVFVALLKGEDEATNANVRWAALTTTIVTFVVSVIAWVYYFDPSQAGFQLLEDKPWLSSTIRYKLGVDGVSMPFVLLTTFLMPFCIAASWVTIDKRVKEYFIAFLVLESLMIGVFVALDLVLFYIFFEAGLIPMFLIIGVWGGKRRIYASFKFFLYTLLGSLLMLIAIMAMYWQVGTTDVAALLKHPFAPDMQKWLWLAFFASFAVKMPMWPVHTWLPDAHVEAPTAGSVILAGILLKMGGYGFIRFSLPMFPDASVYFAPLVFTLSLIAIVYTSLVALVQEDMKKLIAYSSVAHMGFVTMGIFSMNPQGVQGAIFQMISHGLVSGALFLCVGVVYDRLHTREIAAYGGIVRRMPVYAVMFMVFTMANVGLPGTSGFVGEFLTLLGGFKASSWVALAATLGVILSAAYALYLYRRVVFGELVKPSLATLQDLDAREIAILAPLVALVIYYGVHPQPILDACAASVQTLLASVAKAAAVKTAMLGAI